MAKRFKPIGLKGIKTYSIKDRKSKVSVEEFAEVYRRGASFAGFYRPFRPYWAQRI